MAAAKKQSRASSTRGSKLEILAFKSAEHFEKWLGKNHDHSPGIWIQIAKKDSNKKSVTYAEALDVALCYGWIDGQKESYDESSWLQRFTPRTAKSGWSKRNTEHIGRLTKDGRMKPSGLAAVEAAKKSGAWDKAYDGQGSAEVPEDFLAALARNKKAKAFFDTLNKTNLFIIAYRLQTAKKPETREKRMAAILKMMSEGKKLQP